MAKVSFIKSPSDFDNSVVSNDRVLEFTGLSSTGVPTPFYKLADGTIIQLYQAILDAVAAARPTSGGGLSYVTFETVVADTLTIPGIPASVLLNDKYYIVEDTCITPIPGTTDWSLNISKILELADMTTFSGHITVFYNPVDFFYTPDALSFTITNVTADPDVNGTYVPVESEA